MVVVENTNNKGRAEPFRYSAFIILHSDFTIFEKADRLWRRGFVTLNHFDIQHSAFDIHHLKSSNDEV